MVAHYQRNFHDAGVEHGRKQEKARTCHVNDIWFEILDDLGPFHFWQVYCQADMIVQRESKTLSVTNRKSLMRSGQIFHGRFTVNCEDIDFIARLFQEFEHFFEAIRVARNMSERCRFYHKTNLSFWIALEGRGIGSDGHGQLGHLERRWSGSFGDSACCLSALVVKAVLECTYCLQGNQRGQPQRKKGIHSHVCKVEGRGTTEQLFYCIGSVY